MTAFWKNLLTYRFPMAPLTAILVLAFVLRVHNLNYNSLFYDEALYIVLGNSFWTEGDLDLYTFSWVGGLPFFYPVLTALFYHLGGVTGARFLTVLLGTLSVYLMYVLTVHVRLSGDGQRARVEGLFAAFLLAVLAIPIHLSRLAIYDMLSFTLFLAGLAMLVWIIPRTYRPTRRWRILLLCSAGLFFLSVLAKYVTLGLLPFVLGWALAESRRHDREMLTDVGTYFLLPLIIGLAGYGFLLLSSLLGFFRLQLPTEDFQAGQVFREYVPVVIVPFLLAVGGVAIARHRHTRVLAAGLAAVGLWVPVMHLITRNSAAVQQHAFLSLLFFLPAAAYFLYDAAIRYRARLGLLAVAFLMTATAIWSARQVRILDTSWSDATPALTYLRSVVQPNDAILSSEDDATLLFLSEQQPGEVAGIYYFEYADLAGEPAYRAALQERYFAWIMLTDGADGAVAQAVQEQVGHGYAVSHTAEPYIIYRRQ